MIEDSGNEFKIKSYTPEHLLREADLRNDNGDLSLMLRAGAEAMERLAQIRAEVADLARELDNIQREAKRLPADKPKPQEQSQPKCSFCGTDAEWFVQLERGCFARPDDQWQFLCHHHGEKSTPAGNTHWVLLSPTLDVMSDVR